MSSILGGCGVTDPAAGGPMGPPANPSARTTVSRPARDKGGCLCGRIRYRIDGPIPSVAQCHCRMCQRASGAVVMTWALIRPETFALTRGEPGTWWSSAKGERTFCPGCGAQITFRNTRAPDELGVTLASLDDAAAHAATHHIHTANRLPWVELDRNLRAYPNEPGDDPAR